MKIFFYSSHTLHPKVLIPLIVRLADRGHDIHLYRTRVNFPKYDPRKYSGDPTKNTVVNKGSYDYIARMIGYGEEWNSVKKKLTFLRIPKFPNRKIPWFPSLKKYDAIIGATKDIKHIKGSSVKPDMLGIWQKEYPKKMVFAVGYQHMPFIISLNGHFKEKNLPDRCMDVFTKSNPFSKIHRFSEYISNYEISFRCFSYLEKIYTDYYSKRTGLGKKYVLIFHPGGYRGVITDAGEKRSVSYGRQREFLDIICSPILERGLIPVIKIHPLAARYHLREDILTILHYSFPKDKRDFSRVIVEDADYYKYAYAADTIVTFGSSGVYELFSINAPNILICDFLGKSRSRKFSFLKGIFINSIEEYKRFWAKKRDAYFSDAYRKDPFLNKIYESYSGLFAGDTSERILGDMGLL